MIINWKGLKEILQDSHPNMSRGTAEGIVSVVKAYMKGEINDGCKKCIKERLHNNRRH